MLYQLKDAEQDDAGLVETSALEDKVKELWKQALEDCYPLAEDYKNPVEILEELLIPEYPDSKQVFVDAEIHP